MIEDEIMRHPLPEATCTHYTQYCKEVEVDCLTRFFVSQVIRNVYDDNEILLIELEELKETMNDTKEDFHHRIKIWDVSLPSYN